MKLNVAGVQEPFSELADGSVVVGHWRTTEAGPFLEAISLMKGGIAVYDSRTNRSQRLRVYPLTKEWRLEPREAEGEVLVVGEG